MLGRLQMSLADVQSAYVDFSKQVFTPKRHTANPARLYDYLQANGTFDAQPLNDLIEGILTGNGMQKDTLLKDESPNHCKVSVTL